MKSINPNAPLNVFKPQGVKNPKEAELGIFYTNDMHGDVNHLAREQNNSEHDFSCGGLFVWCR